MTPAAPRLRSIVAVLALVALDGAGLRGQVAPRWIDEYREPAARLVREAESSPFAWRRLAVLTDTIGHRLSGTPELEHAVSWAAEEMKRDGLENVHTERVVVPKWVRGHESAEIVEPARQTIVMLGLGSSVGTPPGGLQAEALIVSSFRELDERRGEARGKIVVYNVPFTNNYFDARTYRITGPSRAATYGAVAMLIRSVAPPGRRLPHTGSLQYEGNAPRIPAAAITSEDADRLQRMAARGNRIVLRLQMDAHFEADAESANVVGELVGREKPDEIVVVGGHLDSWDVGDGASDDGGGCVVTWEALRLMKKLGLRPRRTVRLVLWTNEENGTRGGEAYRDQHRAELAKHVMMLESDLGVFRPTGFGVTGNARAMTRVRAIAGLLGGLADQTTGDGEGADIGPSVREAHIPAIALNVDGDFWSIHHTAADTIDKIDPADMAQCAAVVAVMTYVVAEMPERLGE